MKKWFFTLLFFSFIAFNTFAQQNTLAIQRTLNWAASPILESLPDERILEAWAFEGCNYTATAPGLPLFSERFALAADADLSVVVADVQWEAFPKKSNAKADANLGSELLINAYVGQERKNFWGYITFIPIRKTNSGFERATSFTLQVTITPKPEPQGVQQRGGPFTSTSVLANGAVYKFGVSQTTVYKLDYNYLKNDLKISDIDNIDPRTIRIYGNGGRMLPERVSDPRIDDLRENAIFISGEGDGKFNTSDYILIYASGPDNWNYRPNAQNSLELSYSKHLYDRNAWYFLKIGEGNGLRISDMESLPAASSTEEFDDVQRIEDERTNLLDFYASTQGSGKRWFGDYFNQTRSRDYEFNFPNIVSGSTTRLRAEFAGRSRISQTVTMSTTGLSTTRTISSVNVGEPESLYASVALLQGNTNTVSDKFSVRINYPNISDQSEGWLDYIEVNARRRLIMTGQIMEFRDTKTLTQTATTFRLSGISNGLNIWDITDPTRSVRQKFTTSGNIAEFGASTQNVLRNYVAFYDNSSFSKPEISVGRINNQNLHGIDNKHLAIIYHPEFEADAKRLAEHRRTFGKLDVALVNINELFNEFSSGAKDPTAIRDFAVMLLERQPNKFEYLLLFGDGSFDPKNLTNSTENKDFIPVFETWESLEPILAYPCDDYFSLLSPSEGANINFGTQDIAVGRITARNRTESSAIVDKIIAYDLGNETLGDWRLRLMYLADDEDGNAHITQAETLTASVRSEFKYFNPDNVYFDAYQQVATSGGARFPDAKVAINAGVFKGAQVVNYIGHGGPRGWAQERVIDNNDIADWDNPNRYPLFITATCSFGGYDDYTTVTGGEQVLAKQKSGAIGLFTTTRAVYIIDNNALTTAVQKYIYRRVNGQYRSIGDILRDAKNSLGSSTFDNNARRFTLLGDPSMFLAMPEYSVYTTKINGKEVNTGKTDTLRSLMPVEIEGKVTDTLGNLLPDFNGRVYVTVFDKAQTLQTLGQDPGRSYVQSFKVQRNIIFRGVATVNKGLFKVKFIMPKDINFQFGLGKISYYAENGTPYDGAGYDESIVIGGNANLIVDDKPPLVVPYLNTDAFAFGGITDDSPKILVECTDDNGMNVSGASLGHDLTAVLDGNVLETIVLNEFYSSNENDYKTGRAIYPLRNLSVGRHTLRVKGWDVANNPGEGYTEFVVADDGKAALGHVLNYPNPFTTNTYFQFEHNLVNQVLDVQINIFSVSGKLVKTLQQSSTTDSYRIDNIQWDGRDDYGDQLAKGVYLYKVKVRGTDESGKALTTESEFEKLVILK